VLDFHLKNIILYKIKPTSQEILMLIDILFFCDAKYLQVFLTTSAILKIICKHYFHSIKNSIIANKETFNHQSYDENYLLFVKKIDVSFGVV